MSETPQAQQSEADQPSRHWTITLASMVIFGGLGAFLGFRLGKFGAHVDALATRSKARFLGFGHKVLTFFGGFLGAAGAGYATSQTKHQDDPDAKPAAKNDMASEQADQADKDTPQLAVTDAEHKGSMNSAIPQLAK